MDFEKVFNRRYSCRSFTKEPVSEKDIETIVRAGQLAPLAAGDFKTSHLTVVQNSGLMEEIREACMFPQTSNGQKPVDMFLVNLKTVDMFLEPKVRTGRIVDMFLTAILRTGTKNDYLFR